MPCQMLLLIVAQHLSKLISSLEQAAVSKGKPTQILALNSNPGCHAALEKTKHILDQDGFGKCAELSKNPASGWRLPPYRASAALPTVTRLLLHSIPGGRPLIAHRRWPTPSTQGLAEQQGVPPPLPPLRFCESDLD